MMTTHRALSSRSWGMSSGMSRISWMTVPAFCNRSFSSFAFSSAGRANEKGASTSALPKITAKRFISVFHPFFRRFVLPIPALVATPIGHDNNDTAHQRQRAKNRRKRNGVMLFLRRLDWTDVYDFLLCCVGQALICQCDQP